MTLGTDLAAALPQMRAEAESRMSETVAAGEFTDGVADDGSATRVLVVERYTGKGRIRYGTLGVLEPSAAANPLTEQAPYLSIPWGSPRLFEGDEVRCTASTSDGLLVDRDYKIAGNAVIGQVTAHRYPLTEIT